MIGYYFFGYIFPKKETDQPSRLVQICELIISRYDVAVEVVLTF